MMKPVAALAALALIATSCGGGPADSGEPRVVASFYPLAWIAEEIAGRDIEVVDLTPAGVEPHDLELSPSQVGTISSAGLVLYLGSGFQPGLEAVIESEDASAFDVLEGTELMTDEHDGGGPDPHVWLDPTRMVVIARETGRALAEAFPGQSDELLESAGALEERLSAMDGELEAGLAECERAEFVTSHAAFGYLADRYGLEQIAISGLSPEAEPSPGRIAEVIELARERGVTTIFFETLVSPDIAETIADEIGVETAVLEPIETRPAEGDYLDAMARNLDALRLALGCV